MPDVKVSKIHFALKCGKADAEKYPSCIFLHNFLAKRNSGSPLSAAVQVVHSAGYIRPGTQPEHSAVLFQTIWQAPVPVLRDLQPARSDGE